MARVWVRSRLRGEDDAERVLRLVTDFERWPQASDAVRSVDVERQADGTEVSTWEVTFREGLLRWTERDWLELDRQRACFDLVGGDPHLFNGVWQVEPDESGSILTLDAEFDLGMPSLAHVLDPIAIEALEEAIESVLLGLFGEGLKIEFSDAAPSPAPQD
jgi:ribosome-associated toxin RatA of RatAB toxin-antitoxin module